MREYRGNTDLDLDFLHLQKCLGQTGYASDGTHCCYNGDDDDGDFNVCCSLCVLVNCFRCGHCCLSFSFAVSDLSAHACVITGANSQLQANYCSTMIASR